MSKFVQFFCWALIIGCAINLLIWSNTKVEANEVYDIVLMIESEHGDSKTMADDFVQHFEIDKVPYNPNPARRYVKIICKHPSFNKYVYLNPGFTLPETKTKEAGLTGCFQEVKTLFRETDFDRPNVHNVVFVFTESNQPKSDFDRPMSDLVREHNVTIFVMYYKQSNLLDESGLKKKFDLKSNSQLYDLSRKKEDTYKQIFKNLEDLLPYPDCETVEDHSTCYINNDTTKNCVKYVQKIVVRNPNVLGKNCTKEQLESRIDPCETKHCSSDCEIRHQYSDPDCSKAACDELVLITRSDTTIDPDCSLSREYTCTDSCKPYLPIILSVVVVALLIILGVANVICRKRRIRLFGKQSSASTYQSGSQYSQSATAVGSSVYSTTTGQTTRTRVTTVKPKTAKTMKKDKARTVTSKPKKKK